MKNLKETRRLLKIVHTLRKKCPWDSRQSHKSLAPHLLEEAYETLEAIRTKNAEKLKEELGDVLLQVVLHAELANEKKLFSFEDIAKTISEKMVRRHPHIWKKGKKKDYRSHMKIWTSIKSSEKDKESYLAGIPTTLPSLQLSQRYGEIASSVGFDWSSYREVFKKLIEEIKELKSELSRKHNKNLVAIELGDVFFVLANLCRHLGINAEESAKMGALKFLKRFSYMEKFFKKRGKKLSECSISELEKAWNKVKKRP